MKTRNIFLMLAVGAASLFCGSCMDGDWDEPNFDGKVPYGNNEIQEDSVITIAELKKMYPSYAANYTCTEMTHNAQLKVYVTGNDIQGNLYNAISVQDENGDALIIAISENGLYGYLPVGQEILIDTKGLYIGGYGSQPQIGTPYKKNATSDAYVSRMASNIWQKHFKILPTKKKIMSIEECEDEYGGDPDPDDNVYVIPEYKVAEFLKLNIAENCGKLMTITGVEVDGADGTKTWAAEKDAGTQTSVTLYFKGQSKNLEIYTSTYSKFANAVIPQGTLSLTGIWKRYNNYWELILRSENDIQVNNKK